MLESCESLREPAAEWVVQSAASAAYLKGSGPLDKHTLAPLPTYSRLSFLALVCLCLHLHNQRTAFAWFLPRVLFAPRPPIIHGVLAGCKTMKLLEPLRCQKERRLCPHAPPLSAASGHAFTAALQCEL